MKPHVVAGIFARAGSKGVPRKNVRLLGGVPLIAHAVAAARSSPLIDRVFVSTDDEEIARAAREAGAEVPFMRPAELAGDSSPEWLSWQHAIRTLDGAGGSPAWDAFVSVPTTSPLRAVEDVDACVRTLLHGEADMVITVKPSSRSPYFNMVTLDESGRADLVMPPAHATVRRQDAAPTFDITTVAYAARPAFVLSASSMFEGRVEAVVVPEERALDIDTEFDFQIAEFLMARRGRP